MSNLSLDLSIVGDLSIYIHVPFCDSLCDFCAFSKVETDPSKIERYVEDVCREIELFCDQYDLDLNEHVFTCYFGGGTPSVLKSHQILRILSYFNITGFKELTIECHPDHLNETYLEELLGIGFNRISVGIENTHNEMLLEIGRTPNKNSLLEISELFSKFKFENWSTDLMFGYSKMSLGQFSDMLDSVLNLTFPPAHFSLYALNLEPGTSLFFRDNFNMSDDLVEYYELIENKMTASGYMFEEISNWHKPNHGSIHNQNYWDLGNWVGFGPGAYSTIRNLRWFNTKKVENYFRKVESSVLPIAHTEVLAEYDLKFESLMLSLRTPRGIDRRHLSEDLLKQGLIRVDKNTDRYVLTPLGKALSNYVCGKIQL